MCEAFWQKMSLQYGGSRPSPVHGLVGHNLPWAAVTIKCAHLVNACERAVVVDDSSVSYHFFQKPPHGCCAFPSWAGACRSLFLNFPSHTLSLFQRCSLSPEEEVEGHGRHCHYWRRMCWGQRSLPLGQRWHEGRGAVGEVRANSWIHLACCTSEQSSLFFSQMICHLLETWNGKMWLHVSGHVMVLALHHLSRLNVWCFSPSVHNNDWINLTVILPSFPSINWDRSDLCFCFHIFVQNHVIRLLVDCSRDIVLIDWWVFSINRSGN